MSLKPSMPISKKSLWEEVAYCRANEPVNESAPCLARETTVIVVMDDPASRIFPNKIPAQNPIDMGVKAYIKYIKCGINLGRHRPW